MCKIIRVTINISESNNFLLYVIQNSIQSHHLFRMLHPSFRTVMVSITFEDSSIHVLQNSWKIHLYKNQIIKKKKNNFLRKSIQIIV